MMLALLLAAAGLSATDDFDRGLCIRPCPGAVWALAQQQLGRVAVVAAPRRAGRALLATASARRGMVPKAALIARSAPIMPGATIRLGFDLYVPKGTPLDSIQLVDLECGTCAEGGNPGIRLYLRDGRLRIDRSKIGIRHAWTRDGAPQLSADRWHRIALAVTLSPDAEGTAEVSLDGVVVLAARGATMLARGAGGGHVDRLQIGVTANSNPVPVRVYIDRVTINVRPRGG